jgi:DNA invertase Pin-like site-specific DNA recombinase
LTVLDDLTSRGIGFRSLTEGLHTDGPMGRWARRCSRSWPPLPNSSATR